MIAFIAMPLFARADVLINEIAWMGAASSASDEWMELYNNGDASVDLSDWMFNAADGTPNIALQGMIPAKSFFLLERTDDSSVPNIAADLIYTGALSNSGELLILRNASGVEADMADGSGGWSAVGGNNTTKETAQRTVSGWITGAPTPKAANGAMASDNSSVPASMDSGSAPISSPVSSQFTPWFKARIYGGGDVLMAGVEAEFRGGAEGLNTEEINKARFLWSFGDGAYQEGSVARHTYTRLGSYNISLNVILESYSSSDYALIKVVADQTSVLPAPINAQMANNPAVVGQRTVAAPSESAPKITDVSQSGAQDDLLARENVENTPSNTANLPDVGMGVGNFWFWFLASLAAGVIGAAGFLLVKIFYWR